MSGERGEMMAEVDAPYHAHIYYEAAQRRSAEALRESFLRHEEVLFVGRMIDEGVGPHPIAQYEVHFRENALAAMVSKIEASGLKALVHPLTDDDLADHTRLAKWIGGKVDLDLETLDPPGHNQGIARFGKTDF